MSTRIVALQLVVMAAAVATIAAVPSTPPPPPDPRAVASAMATHPALSSVLNQLYDSWFGSADPLRRAGLRHLVVDGDSVEVVVVSRPGAAVAAGERARQLGGRVSSTYRDLVFATVPIAQLPMLASDPSVLQLRTPFRSRPDVVSEGVAVHHADGLHGQGITGQGVKVGVLDCGGFAGYQSLLGSELPAQITLWTGGSVPVGSGVHGTACAEVIHDMAPDAELFFAHDHTEADYYAAVDWLIAQQVDVISYSCSWTGPFPGDGGGDPYNPVNQKVSDARAAGVLFVSSAGNSADGESYRDWYQEYSNWGWHAFDGQEASNLFYLYAGADLYVTLTWSDWPADPLTQGSAQNYDLDVWIYDDPDWVPIALSENPQAGLPGQLPFEEISYAPAASAWHAVIIRDVATTGPRFLSLRSFDCTFQHFDPDYSVFTPETPDGISVGAVHWNGLGLEPFSSQGPLFGPGGVPSGGTLAPQLVAVDGVSTVTYGASNGLPWGGGGTGFFGTSASCPHVAGGAALLLQQSAGMTVDQLEAVLLGGATDMGPPGPDNRYGFGLMNLDAGPIFADGFESGDMTAWSSTVP